MSGTQVTITILLVTLGFMTTAAISGTGANSLLANARQSDLVSVLDDLAQREARLQSEITRLENARESLLGGDQFQALNEAKSRAQALSLLAGSTSVVGPGVRVAISGNISASTMLDAIQELRDGGATAIQVSDKDLSVRVVANTWFADSPDGVTVSGTALKVPLEILVIGDSSVLVPALQIPGGLADTIGSGGGNVSITPTSDVEINSVVPLPGN
jgi:uncharacterized protein YlxW (UPF0749 family)